MVKQRTIKKQTSLKGIGIHTGKQVNITFKPAQPDSGINFIRTDLPGKPVIPARIQYLLDTSVRERRSSIGKNGAEVHTIEHLLACFFGLGIDNIYVEIDTSETPALDGSAKDIVRILKEAGICGQDAPRKELLIKEPLWLEEEDSALIILPSENLSISYTLDYSYAGLKPQHNHFKLDPESFEKEIAPSRTFCLKKEVVGLISKGLGKGASLDNTVVVDEKGTPTVDLRFDDEFLRHKVLDIIGDIFLAGYFLKGRIIGIKSGHCLNLKMAQKIMTKYGNVQRTGKNPLMNKEAIKKIIPHREPFLLIDEIIELEEMAAVGIKYVKDDEYYFPGHFPERPIMPGVLIIEALAQVGGVLMLNKPQNKGKLAYFLSINNAKFRKVVKPGDELRLEIEIMRFKTKTGQVHGAAFVDGNIVAEADLMFSVIA